jgi:hypothetical protein
MKSELQSYEWRSNMISHDTITNLPWQKGRSWLLLLLRWLFGGMVGFGLSAWICFGYITNTITGPFLWLLDLIPILSFIMGGSLLLFDPSLSGHSAFIELFARMFPNIDQDFLAIMPAALFCGFIGALLASGNKVQIKVAVILLILEIVIGSIFLFYMLRFVPT